MASRRSMRLWANCLTEIAEEEIDAGSGTEAGVGAQEARQQAVRWWVVGEEADVACRTYS